MEMTRQNYGMLGNNRSSGGFQKSTQKSVRDESVPEQPTIGSPPSLFLQTSSPTQSESRLQSPTHLSQGDVGEQKLLYDNAGKSSTLVDSVVGISVSISVVTTLGTSVESESVADSSDGISVDTKVGVSVDMEVGVSVEISVVTLEGIAEIVVDAVGDVSALATFGSTQ
jgi:hypothetical protein